MSETVVQTLAFDIKLTGYFVKYVLTNLSSALHNVDMVPGGSGSLEIIFCQLQIDFITEQQVRLTSKHNTPDVRFLT